MNSLFDPTLCVRYTFYPDRASEFIDEPGQCVHQTEYDDIEEILEFVREFSDAIEEANVLVPGLDQDGKPTVKVVNLSDYYEVDDDAN